LNDPELEALFKMIEELIDKVRGTPGVTDEEIERIQTIISKYRSEGMDEQVKVLTQMREDLYSLYQEHHTMVNSIEKYSPAWEKERKLRDMYFKFLNIPILFLIGMRDETFTVNENVNNHNNYGSC
jgi:hypothetical protein